MIPGVIDAPMGAGKTRNADVLHRQFPCRVLMVEWGSRSPLPPNALALTR